MKWLLALTLLVAMAGCAAHRRAPKPPIESAFPVIITPYPVGYNAWLCEHKVWGGDVCDAINTTIDLPPTISLIRVDQPNGLVVYWRARMTQ